MLENRRWVIFNTSETGSIDFSQVMQTTGSTLRLNLSGSRTFVKYEGNKPSFLTGKTVYTHSQILTELAKDEWSEDDPG